MSAFNDELKTVATQELYDWEAVYRRMNVRFPSLATSAEAVRLAFTKASSSHPPTASQPPSQLSTPGGDDLNLDDLLDDEEDAPGPDPFAFDAEAALKDADKFMSTRLTGVLGASGTGLHPGVGDTPGATTTSQTPPVASGGGSGGVAGGVWDRILTSMGGALPPGVSSRIPLPAPIPSSKTEWVEYNSEKEQPPMAPITAADAPAAEADLAQQRELDAVSAAFFNQVHGYSSGSSSSSSSTGGGGVGGGRGTPLSTPLSPMDERWDILLSGVVLPEEKEGAEKPSGAPPSELNQVLLSLGAAAAASQLVEARAAAIAALEKEEGEVVLPTAPQPPPEGVTPPALSSSYHHQGAKHAVKTPPSSSSSSPTPSAGRLVGGNSRFARSSGGAMEGRGGGGGATNDVEEEVGVEEDEDEEEEEEALDRAAMKAAAARVARSGIPTYSSHNSGPTQLESMLRSQRAASGVLPVPTRLLLPESEDEEEEEEEEEEEDGEEEVVLDEEADQVGTNGDDDDKLSTLTAEERDALDFTPSELLLIPKRVKAEVVERGGASVKVEERRREGGGGGVEKDGEGGGKGEEEGEEDDEFAFTTRILISQKMRVSSGSSSKAVVLEGLSSSLFLPTPPAPKP